MASMYAKTITGDLTAVRVKAGVGIIISDKHQRILLERRSDNGLWGLPGGSIEAGESISEASKREVLEETQLEIRITGLVGVYSMPADGRIVTYPDNGDVAHQVDIVLTADIVCGIPQPSLESLELRFFPPGQLPADMAPPARQPLLDYRSGLNGVIR